MAKLGDIGKVITGNTPKTSDSQNYASNDVCFVKPSDIVDGTVTYLENSEFYVSEYARAKARVLPPKSVLVTCIGIIGKVAINNVECAFNQQINAIIPDKSKCLTEYLAYAIQNKQAEMQDIANAPVVPILNKTQFSDIEIKLPSLSEQENIIQRLNAVSKLISLRKEQLAKLDQLVKSRFIELFGDPEHNEKAIPTLPMTELCEIIDGDRGANYPKQEEFSDNGFCLFLNAKNVTANGFSFENCMFITAEKDKLLRKGKLSRGDVVLTTRGTIGNLAFYDGAVPYEHIRINSGMVILRMKRERITERFFIEQFKMQLASIKEKIASGSAQPQLPISTMNKIVMLVPDVDLQHQFAAFVEQTDKSKMAIQQSLEKLELLKKSLMQEYFG